MRIRGRQFTWSAACAVAALWASLEVGGAQAQTQTPAPAQNPAQVGVSAPNPAVKSGSPACPGAAAWNERLRYVDTLMKAESYAKVKSILEPALKDCDASVRQRALHVLDAVSEEEHPASRAVELWRYLRPKFATPAQRVLDALITLVFAVVVGWLALLAARVWHRKLIVVRPLTISGDGKLDGQHFVAIAALINDKMRAFQRSGTAPAQSRGAPTMVLEDIGVTTAETAVSLAPEQTGKVVAALMKILERPRFVCSGSVHFSGHNTHIVVRLDDGGDPDRIWERSSQPGRLIEDLKDLSFYALQAAASELRKTRD
jgi:hypothetical protein